MRKRGERGFTLVELMVAVMVFTIGAISLASVYLGVARLNEGSRNLTLAMSDTRVLLERIRQVSANGLPSVTGTNWTTWATANGLNTLPNEAVTVTYANPAANPLSVTVRVSWQDRNTARSAITQTLLTQR